MVFVKAEFSEPFAPALSCYNYSGEYRCRKKTGEELQLSESG
jgi:hypothetical protein